MDGKMHRSTDPRTNRATPRSPNLPPRLAARGHKVPAEDTHLLEALLETGQTQLLGTVLDLWTPKRRRTTPSPPSAHT